MTKIHRNRKDYHHDVIEIFNEDEALLTPPPLSRYLNVATLLRYKLDINSSEEFILGPRQVVPYIDMTFPKLMTDFCLESCRIEFMNENIYTGLKHMKLVPLNEYRSLLKDAIEEGVYNRNLLMWDNTMSKFPSGRHIIKPKFALGLGAFREEHQHFLVTLSNLMESADEVFQDDMPITPDFFVEDESGKEAINAVTLKEVRLKPITWPYTPYAPLSSYSGSLSIDREELSRKMVDLYIHKRLYIGISSFQNINLPSPDQRIPVDMLMELYPIWGSVPFSIDTGYKAMDADGLLAAQIILGYRNDVVFNRNIQRTINLDSLSEAQ